MAAISDVDELVSLWPAPEAGAMWDDAKLGLKHLAGWEKVALVSDVEWIRRALKVFALIIPGHVRVFHNNELAVAKRWIAE